MNDHFPIQSLEVAGTYKAFPPVVRSKLLDIRNLIYTIATSNEAIGNIEECLKWNQVSYLTKSPKSGTTIRLGYKPQTSQYAIYVPCTTTLIEDTKEMAPQGFSYEKNRALLFNVDAELPIPLMSEFLFRALTYHKQKRKNL
ncbi:MAG: DUF1801 domain-containing protein [Pseudomonas marincola]